VSPAVLQDHADREAITGALDDTLVVEAAAGTGKTTELVGRIVRILASGRARVDNIVAVTFTEKAAGELKLRLREALDEARGKASGAERDALNEALRSLEEAHVSTIHGFCAELLRERPVEACVDPLFKVLTEPQASRLFEHAFSGWIQGQLERPPEGIRRALRRSVWQGFGDSAREDTPIDRLRRAAWDLAEWRDFNAPWTRREFPRDGAVDALVEDLRAFAALTEGPSYGKDSLFLDTAAARHLASEIAVQQEAGSADYDGWEARFVDLSRDRAFSRVRHGRGPGYKSGVPRQRVVDAYEALRATLDQFRLDADAHLAALLQQELAGAITAYEELKARSGALDFLDLLLKARDLVRGNASVRAGFQDRFTRIFVDEFQDTDPLQAEILLLLAAADPDATDWRTVTPVLGRLFIVGDPKQSIYRFRRADVAIYREVCERLVAAGARRVTLTTSFRGVPGIQALVNAAFAPVMDGDRATLQADYVPLNPHRAAIKGQPSVVVLPVPEPYGTRNVSAVRIETSLPDAVGGYIEWLINDSGWKTGHGRAIQARDICILFRRFVSFGEDMTQPYVRALEARGVHHVLVGGRTFHNREEVETLRAALAAVEWPDDELSVFAALRGALFAVGDEELLEWKQRFGGFHPFRIPRPDSHDPTFEHLRPIAEALKVLQQLHRRRNYRPIAETVQELLAQTRAHVGIVLRTAGEQALANVLHVAQLAREYEANGGLSFRGFVDELTAAADAADAAEAPILEEGSDGVRMMTVHKAKGLEFPIVVLADVTCKLARSDAGRWLDPDHNRCALRLGGWSPIDLVLHGNDEVAKDRSEAQRLAYVAATRARDLLVVPAVGDGPYEGGWLDALTPAVYPPESRRRSPQSAPGVPLFKSKDTVLNRPDGDPARPHTVAPGTYTLSTEHQAPSTEHRAPSTEHRAPSTEHRALSTEHRAPSTEHSITWWDPRALHLDAVAPFGLRRDDLIVKAGDLFGVDERLAEYERWRDERAGTIARAQQPALRVQTATAWAAEAATTGVDTLIAESADITVVALPGNADRPRGPRFGTLVHAILATLPLNADNDLVERGARVQARIFNAPADELGAAIDVVTRVLGHELLARARASSAVKRETPVSWVQKDGALIEGVLDLAFDEGDATVVVDFKTDHELAAGETRYRAQLQQYLGAVSKATGRPARGVLFRV
jgi:ATP-dependent exoDNAse (exonuclease V) beta subunit